MIFAIAFPNVAGHSFGIPVNAVAALCSVETQPCRLVFSSA